MLNHVDWVGLSRFKSITSQNTSQSHPIHSNPHVIKITEQSLSNSVFHTIHVIKIKYLNEGEVDGSRGRRNGAQRGVVGGASVASAGGASSLAAARRRHGRAALRVRRARCGGPGAALRGRGAAQRAVGCAAGGGATGCAAGVALLGGAAGVARGAVRRGEGRCEGRRAARERRRVEREERREKKQNREGTNSFPKPNFRWPREQAAENRLIFGGCVSGRRK
jgi:hypothetical protein